MRKAVIRDSDGFVVNVIEITFPNSWQPPADCYCIDAGDGSPGDTWDGTKFVKSEPSPQEKPHIEIIEERLQAVEERLGIVKL